MVVRRRKKMAIHLWCVVAAWVLVYAGKLPVAMAMQKAGGYDNHHPRTQEAALTGWGARSLAAHLNGFETFAPFAVAVLVAHISGASTGLVDTLAVLFIVSRVFYVGFYLADLAALRSTVWTIGWIVTLVLFLSPVL
jgi:uncharacterized MAPEG superfamily protein